MILAFFMKCFFQLVSTQVLSNLSHLGFCLCGRQISLQLQVQVLFILVSGDLKDQKIIIKSFVFGSTGVCSIFF